MRQPVNILGWIVGLSLGAIALLGIACSVWR